MRKKFTLVELLIVVSIIAVLASLLLPTLLKAKHRARLAACSNRLHQNGRAMFIYAGDNDSQYPYLTVVADRWAVKGPPNDARPFLNSIYDSLDQMFLCPLNNQPSLMNSTSNEVFGSYGMYAGTTLTIEGTEMFDLMMNQKLMAIGLM